jgi:quinol monooxygenase YgiN
VRVSIWEIAEFSIISGDEDEFERRVLDSEPIFAAAEGCTALRLQRAADVPGRFLLLVEWESVAHHTDKFTTTDGFAAFVGAVSPLWAAEPRVFHTAAVPGGFGAAW